MLAALLLAATLSAIPSDGASVILERGNFEIVVATDACGTTRLAAEELRDLTGKILGETPALVSAPTPGKTSVVVGLNEWSREARISGDAMSRDEFRIRADPVGRRIYLAGRDAGDLATVVREGRYQNMRREMASLYAVYDFLERFAGARFYFPGEIGTILPSATAIRVPASTDLDVRPAFINRNIYFNGDGRWIDGNPCGPDGRCSEKALYYCRLKLESYNIPSCHGQNGFDYVKRFAKTRPDYFCLLPDHANGGALRRDNDPTHPLEYHPNQLCHTSGVWNEFEDDIRKGRKSGPYIDIMPTDGMPKCRCENCQAWYAKAKDPQSLYAVELVWGNVARLVNALNAEGIDAQYTMMAYGSYGAIPECALPSNLVVMIAKPGPWSAAIPAKMKSEADDIRAWSEKLNAKVRVWTYPGKYARKRVECVPQLSHHAYARYFKTLAPYLMGGFVESESDYAIYNYLNYYVFSRLAWYPETDCHELFNEHFRLMFGAAAEEMKAFYTALEKTWLKRICVTDDCGGFDPDLSHRVPDILTLATDVYSPERLAEWETLLGAAEAKVADDAASLRRVRFFRQEFFDRTKRHFGDYLDSLDVARALADRRRRGVSDRIRTVDASLFHARSGAVVRDAAETVTGQPSIRINASSTDGWKGVTVDFASLGLTIRPRMKVRVSYFIKYQDVKPGNADAGFAAHVSYKFRYGWMNPNIPFVGSHGWMHQGFVLDVGKRERQFKTLAFDLLHAVGTAWIDGVQVEEVE